MGPDAFAPGLLQALAALSEFGGGIAWIIGLLVPLASLGIACTMAVAVCMHAFMRGDPFVSVGGSSYELAAVYFCVSILLLAAGPGRFSAGREDLRSAPALTGSGSAKTPPSNYPRRLTSGHHACSY